jgi:formate-dependent phosphoribosylglycinamide formyltransferase (GAR transformylase)
MFLILEMLHTQKQIQTRQWFFMAPVEHRTTHSIEHGVWQNTGFSKYHIANHLLVLNPG